MNVTFILIKVGKGVFRRYYCKNYAFFDSFKRMAVVSTNYFYILQAKRASGTKFNILLVENAEFHKNKVLDYNKQIYVRHPNFPKSEKCIEEFKLIQVSNFFLFL